MRRQKQNEEKPVIGKHPDNRNFLFFSILQNRRCFSHFQLNLLPPLHPLYYNEMYLKRVSIAVYAHTFHKEQTLSQTICSFCYSNVYIATTPD